MALATKRQSSELTEGARKRAVKVTTTYIVLAVLLVVTALWSAAAGQFDATFGQTLRALGNLLFGGGAETADTSRIELVLWEVRLPRIALAAIVGSGLAVAGVALQAVFGNPLAEPGLIGVSSGAAVGAAAVTVLGTTTAITAAAGEWAVALGAFFGGIAATAVVAATAKGGRDVARIILVGVAVNAVCGGLVSLFTYIATPAARDRIVFWQMGSFAAADWTQVGLVLLATVPSAAVLWMLAGKLDLLSLGETQARHLGVDVPKLRRVVITVAALVVAVGVAFSGIIVFIGLVVPHALRLTMGPAHRHLVPAALLGGAVATTIADLAARTLIVGADLPLGMLTALVGGPLFFWLLIRGNRAVKA